MNIEFDEMDENQTEDNEVVGDSQELTRKYNTMSPDEYMKLSEKYAKGLGTDVDREKAKIFYDKAKELGSEMVNLGLGILVE